ncbi:hypothetical protein [Vibrio brasiliensis]
MIKFNITQLNELAYLLFQSTPNATLLITSKKPHEGNHIHAPKLICYMVVFKLLNKLEIEDFDFLQHEFSFLLRDSDRVEELFELYSSKFNAHTQYLVILYEDSNGHPQYRFEFNVSLKKKLIDEFKRQYQRLDLLQVASGIIIDSISVREFGGHNEVINRLGPQPST